MQHLLPLGRFPLGRSPRRLVRALERLSASHVRPAVGAVRGAPAFVHLGLAAGAVAVVAAMSPSGVWLPADAAASGALASAAAAALAAGLWTASARRIDARAGAAVVRFVAMQAAVIAALLVVACTAAGLFRATAPGVFVAAVAAGSAAALTAALAFLDRSRLAALPDLTAPFAVPPGWPAARIAHVHRARLEAALAVDAATARHHGRPSIASRLVVPAAGAGNGMAAPDRNDSLAVRFAAEARLRVLGLVPIAALAVPYAAIAALAVALLATDPVPATVADAGAARPDATAADPGAGAGGQGAGGQGAGRQAGDQGNQGTGSQGTGSQGTGSQGTGSQGGTGSRGAGGGAGGPGSSAAGRGTGGASGHAEHNGDAAGDGSRAAADRSFSGRGGPGRDTAASTPGADQAGSAAGHGGDPDTANRHPANRDQASDKSTAAAATAGAGNAGGSNRSRGSRGDGDAAREAHASGVSPGAATTGTGLLPVAGGGDGMALPGTGTGDGADGVGPGRGDGSGPKPFTAGAPPPARDGGREIVITGIAPQAGAANGPPVADSALARGTSLPPAPLLDWPQAGPESPAAAGAPRPYRPRQALPAWTAPLFAVPSGGSAALPGPR